MTRQLEEALSWRLVTEIWRRFPQRYALLETHPDGGQYDCLSLVEWRDGLHSVLDINRGGSVHVHYGRAPQSWGNWCDSLLGDPGTFLDEITSAIGLVHPKPLPDSTPTTIAFRFVSEFLTHAIGRLEPWECRNGFCDTSGYGGGRREEFFSRFPHIATVSPPTQLAREKLLTDYSYWFMLKRGEPLLALDTDGRLYQQSGKVYDLPAAYAKHRRIWPLIVDTALDLLP